MKTYTVGQIFRLGLLKNEEGKPYRHKSTVHSMVLKHMKYRVVDGKWGKSFAVSEAEIKKFNRHI